MTTPKATPERIVAYIEGFPAHIQMQFLIDRMDMYLGHGFLPDGNGGFRVVHMNIPEEAEELLQFKLGILRSSKTIFQVFWFVNKPDRLQLLRILSTTYEFSKKNYAQLLRDSWIATEFPHQMPINQITKMFQRADPQYLMTKDERKALGDMEDVITIYRGCQDDRAKVKALSWTLSYEKAVWFASRWAKSSGVGDIYKSAVKKSDVYMYTNERGEHEVVVNPYRLKKLQKTGAA